MDENYLFYLKYKNQIADIVTLMTEIFISVLKLETDKIKSIIFSSDKKELTMMTIISLKHIFKEDRIKDFFEKTEIIKEKSKYNLLKKIIDFLAPLKEEKIQLYYYLIKTVSQNDKASSTINEKIDNCSKFINQNSLDQISSKNENQSTHCSLTSNNIIIDVEEHNMNDFKHLQPGYNSQEQISLQNEKNLRKNNQSNIQSNPSKRYFLKGNSSEMSDSFKRDDNYNYLKIFETSKKHSTSNLFQSPNQSHLINDMMCPSNIIENSSNDKFSTFSTQNQCIQMNEKDYNSWGYSGTKSFVNKTQQASNKNSNSNRNEMMIPDPIHSKDIFKSYM